MFMFEVIAVFWDEWLAALKMEAESTSEMSENFYQTARRNNPDDSDLHCMNRC
jgi:hypothetical protein